MATKTTLSDRTIPSREEVLKEVEQIIAELMSIAPDVIQETHALIEDLGCDSLDVAEITMEVEDHFDVSVSDEQAQDIRTVSDVADGVLLLLGRRE